MDLVHSIRKILNRNHLHHWWIWFIFTKLLPCLLVFLPFFTSWITISTLIFISITCILPVGVKIQLNRKKILLPKSKQTKRGKRIYIGTLQSRIIPKRFYLSETDLKRHVFITGLTGMGKSNFVKHLLYQLTKRYSSVSFLLIEFKGEYKEIQKRIPHITILRPGENLKINIFNPIDEDPKIYAEKLMNLFTECQIITFQEEYSAQMEKIFVELLYAVCSDPKRRSWEGFDYYIQQYMKQQNTKYYNLHNTLSGIENRIRRLKNGPLRMIFGKEHDFNLSKIIQNNVIIDLSSIIQKGGTKNDAVFFSNIIFNHVWLFNLKKGPSTEINHFTLIEDSQILLSQKIAKYLTTTTYLEDFALLLRGTGECLITINTRPTISEDVMANAGVIVSFQLSYDQNIMGRLLSLNENKYFYLTLLDIGECLIKTNSIKTPLMVKIPLIKN